MTLRTYPRLVPGRRFDQLVDYASVALHSEISTISVSEPHWNRFIAVHGLPDALVETGGYVIDPPVTPADMTATILHHLGIDPKLQYFDEFQRTLRNLSEGTPVRNLG